MQRIKLTRNKYTLVDDNDYVRLIQWRWHCTVQGYASRKVAIGNKRVNVPMSNAIMNPPKGMVVDHINHNRLDNRRANLRIVTQRQNLINRACSKKGIYQNQNKSKYFTSLFINGKTKYIGSYKTEEEALMAWQQARQVHKLQSL